MHNSNDKFTQLLEYAAQGWRIFPIKSNRKSPPLTAHAFKDASSDVKVIKAWHDQHPRANWAVATGSMSGVFVMDIDVKANKLGQEYWNLLKSLCADPYPTLTCKTPSGGKHYYYKYNPKLPVKSENGFMNGIDVKGDGGGIS
jgi:putative DNA primase/helicase